MTCSVKGKKVMHLHCKKKPIGECNSSQTPHMKHPLPRQELRYLSSTLENQCELSKRSVERRKAEQRHKRQMNYSKDWTNMTYLLKHFFFLLLIAAGVNDCPIAFNYKLILKKSTFFVQILLAFTINGRILSYLCKVTMEYLTNCPSI